MIDYLSRSMLKSQGRIDNYGMPSAIVLVNANFGTDERVVHRIRKIQGVTRAYRVLGVYDIIVLIQTSTISALKSIVTDKIGKVEDVRSVLTMMVAGSDPVGLAA